MGKVTTKLQVTVPKEIAEKYNIHPGDDIEWVPAGDMIRVIPPGTQSERPDVATRLKLFDEATRRQRARQKRRPRGKSPSTRGWTRADLYNRGLPR